jgi:hypothetical protein
MADPTAQTPTTSNPDVSTDQPTSTAAQRETDQRRGRKVLVGMVGVAIVLGVLYATTTD